MCILFYRTIEQIDELASVFRFALSFTLIALFLALILFMAVALGAVIGGDVLVFTASEGGVTDIYALDAARRITLQLTHTTEHEWNLALAGERISFFVTDGVTTALYSVDLYGRDRRLMMDSLDCVGICQIDWVDGQTLIGVFRDSDGDGEVYVLDLATGEYRALTDNRYSETMPALSPDGGTVTYVQRSPTLYQLMIVPLVGGQAFRIADNQNGIADPSWSPDGGIVTFGGIYNPMGGSELFEVQPRAGEVPRRVRFTGDQPVANVTQAVWSPSGAYLAMSAFSNSETSLWIVDTRSSTPLYRLRGSSPVWWR